MPQRTSATEDVSVTDAHLKAQQERLRRERIKLLRRELEATMERLHTIRRELRLLGDRGVRVTTGGTDWNEVYTRLGSTFTAKAMAEMTGATPGLVASIVHRWRTHGRIVATGRGEYRKALRRERRAR